MEDVGKKCVFIYNIHEFVAHFFLLATLNEIERRKLGLLFGTVTYLFLPADIAEVR